MLYADRHIGRIRTVDAPESFRTWNFRVQGIPSGVVTFYFSKNKQPEFHYKNLSGGEKAAFDLVLDLVQKASAYDDTVFMIDEPGFT